MDRDDAIRIAKAYLHKIYEREQIRGMCTSELNYDSCRDRWLITLAFARSWQHVAFTGDRQHDMAEVSLKGSAKTVQIDDETGLVLSLTDRLVELDDLEVGHGRAAKMALLGGCSRWT